MNGRKSLALAVAVAGIGGTAHSVPAAAQTANWSGPYWGIGGGGGWGQQSQSGGILTLPGGSSIVTVTTTSIVISDGKYNLSGGLVGGSVGYNFQNGRTVYGVEADGSWASISGSGTCGVGSAAPHACGGDIDSLITVRGRIGYDIGPLFPSLGDLLPYVAGGFADAHIHAWDSFLGGSGEKSAAGWTIGGGVEAMLGSNWSVRAEYLHVDLGNPAVFTALPPNPEHVATTADLFRVGLDYHFTWTGSPPPSSPILHK